MPKPGASPVRRWLPIASVIFGVFALLQVGLFSWLILRSLSQREVDRILLSTRERAAGVADQFVRAAESHDEDLLTAVAVSREVMTFLESELLQREFVEEVEVTDSDGLLVYREQTRRTIPVAGGLQGSADDLLGLTPGEIPSGKLERKVDETTATWEVEEPIGDLGFLRVRIDRVELQRRVTELRRDLIRRSSLIGGATFLMLLTAYAGVWRLLRRAERLEEQAAEAERMAYVGRLAAGLAHEIRNPLNSLSLNMQMLEEDLAAEAGPCDSRRRLLAITRDEIERLGHLATDFLSYSRSRPLEQSVVPAVQLLEEAAAVMDGELRERQVGLAIDDRSGGARVSVDPDQLRQLLLNLLKNALAATEGSGRPGRIELAAQLAGGKVVLEVRDNGCGMSEEEQARMFDLFFSTRKGGTGLGLAIVERIARAHGAKLEVDSEPGRGTGVRLLLPAVGPTARAVEPAATTVSAEA